MVTIKSKQNTLKKGNTMAKTYNVTQHINLNGTKKSTSFRFIGEESELTALCAQLEGGYTVTEQNDSLTNMTAADTVVTNYKRTNRISMSGKTAEGHFVSANIKPFKGSIYFKQTADSSDIEAVFANSHPFPLAPAVKPSTISIGLTEDIVANQE